MCGLAGTYSKPGQRASRAFLLNMAGELSHRGPDGTGLYLDGRFGMVNTRLAIVDLVSGDQPISDEAGRFWVMQNGEIYNHIELRQELEKLGHRFSTSCDTEVLAHAYEEWAADCLPRLNGDFAFAVWDRRKQELFLARDRFGVRPLFITEFGGAFSFASEAKALLRHPGAGRELNPGGLIESFTTWSTSPEHSAFTGIRELPAAHWLRVRADGFIECHSWWDLCFGSDGDRLDASDDELAEQLRSLLDDATRLRLRADVPVGAYLSGGLDSSLIAALARNHVRERLFSFGIGFADERFDESLFQERMARELRTDLTRVSIDAQQIGELFPRAIALSEQPTLRTALAPLLRLSGAVRASGLKVVLTGEGADELFAGYDIFRESKVRRFWARDPDSHLRPLLLQRLYPYLPRDLRGSGALLKRFFALGLTDTDDPFYSHRIRFANTARCLRTFDPELLERASREGTADPIARLRRRLPPEFESFTPLGKAQYLETITFLNGYLLHSQGDRMLMGHSIEGRFPFLDYRVAEFAAQLPDSLRLRGLREKYVLRRAAAELLPEEIHTRVKRPYRAPILRAFVGPSAPLYVHDLLRPARLREASVFSPDAVARVMKKCETHADTGVSETDEMALVGIISVMLLDEQFVARPVLAAPARPSRVVVEASAKPAEEALALR